MNVSTKLDFVKAKLILALTILLYFTQTSVYAQIEHIKIKGDIVGRTDKAYVYVITGDVKPEFNKGIIQDGRFQISLNKQLKDTVLHAGLFLSRLSLMNNSIYKAELKAKKINPGKDLYWFLIDSNYTKLTINIFTNTMATNGGMLNREKALNDSILVQYYKDVNQRGTDYANRKRTMAEIDVINHHNSSLLAAESLRNLICLPLPGGAYPYRNEIMAALNNLDKKAIGKARIDNMQMLYENMLKRYTPKENLSFPNLELVDDKGSLTSFTNISQGYDFILIDFWATWCGPCIQQHPQLKEIQEQFRENKRLKIIGVALDKQIKPWQTYLSKNPFNYTQYWITPAMYKHIDEELGLATIPSYILINAKNGKITDYNMSITDIVTKLKEKGL
ncbi:TlpA family protein disulfide reductase [Mucilaginibacter sp. Bleaf8]|uniref:TlpA family protein disulfide reductase n=1 Tax=Mucilaginibacter sp. Bleaf8 TaxID=2834430 RepID=UPI001BCD21D9|nr:TlpA disulfide reductase family protein [Mucilaginibacter sp. Bleaf8]MBS7566949.1 TlpA family protein disulfide reductase [Mucilaginibacter sp. Bleaf8]